MSDNVKRGFRTAVQVVLGTLATGGLTKIWEQFNGSHSVDPTVQIGVGLITVGIVAWAQAMLEDNLGMGLLVPTDRMVGDAVLNKGIGRIKLLDGKLPRTAFAALNGVGVVKPVGFSDLADPTHRVQHRQ